MKAGDAWGEDVGAGYTRVTGANATRPLSVRSP